MPKRKTPSQQPDDEPPLRRSTRQKTTTTAAAAAAAAAAPPATDSTSTKKKKPTTIAHKSSNQPVAAAQKQEDDAPEKASSTTTTNNKTGNNKQEEKQPQTKRTKSNPVAAGAKPNGKTEEDPVSSTTTTGRQYWLMKAEPESRIENGVDVKFSIDDLASKTEPEPWDGIRNYVARNHLRAMKRGDMSFFYHSNCKEPGIVGVMEVVQEHSPDLSAHDPKTPYYDPKSSPSNPKWSVVHVEFRSKFDVQIGLKELREMGGPGQPLENMQVLKQSRLSVSKVSEPEWEYLMSVAEKKAKGA